MENIKDKILEEYKKGNIVIKTPIGLLVYKIGLQYLIELLPKSIIINSVKHWFCVSQNCLLTEFQVMYFDGDDSYAVIKQDKSLLQSAYNMLIWVIENGHLKTK